MAISVPLDVQILIIEWVFRSSQHALIDYTTLNACALVRRAWTPTAQRLLFRRIWCISQDDSYKILRLLVETLGIRPHLAAHVRHIRIAWPSQPPGYGTVCLRLLELCRHVEGISFLDFIDFNYRKKALGAEFDARLRAIQLRPTLLEMIGVDKTICRTIMDMFPGVRVLVDRAGYEYPLPASAEALEILAINARSCFSLSEPLPALRHLCLILPRWSDKALCERFISADILPQLQSLQIKGVFPPAEILDQLAQLTTLVVGELPGQRVLLPPSLRHVGYHPWGAAPGGHAEFLVDPLRALPRLQFVSVTHGVEEHVHAALEGMCRHRGVDFGTYETPDCFQVGWPGQWTLEGRTQPAQVAASLDFASILSRISSHSHMDWGSAPPPANIARSAPPPAEADGAQHLGGEVELPR
ncbi:hypothetical protein FA95DRAFT_1611004 [Auriscalpium vulgare]|uniref:Uncharacterized protein n=1 Tax=Auriscalpium vulgare TaxID=40419 RepID=A0ACB8RB91_9AGAM|nr:hypothetical protein FA95DRAFT_1611004 [Auriscalpium vulgare]